MSDQLHDGNQKSNPAATLAIAGMGIGVIAIIVAIGAIVVAQRAMESADMAERRAEQAIERQRTMSGAGSSSNQLFDSRATFLASTADQRDHLDEGLELWSAMFGRYEDASASIQYRAFTDFFDMYPMVPQYFFFVSREELLLNPTDQKLHEEFGYWLQLRQSMSP